VRNDDIRRGIHDHDAVEGAASDAIVIDAIQVAFFNPPAQTRCDFDLVLLLPLQGNVGYIEVPAEAQAKAAFAAGGRPGTDDAQPLDFSAVQPCNLTDARALCTTSREIIVVHW